MLNKSKHVVLCNETIKYNIVNKKHVNEVIKSGITSKSENTNEICIYNCEMNIRENNWITSDKEVKEALNVKNGLLNIY